MPNLILAISPAQGPVVADAVDRLRALSRESRSSWFGPVELRDGALSVSPFELADVLALCDRSPATEVELFRLRRAALVEIERRLARCRTAAVWRCYEDARQALLAQGVGSESGACLPAARLCKPVPLVR